MDDLIPNEGSTFYSPEIPEETKLAIEDEKLKASQAVPFISDVDEWFKEQLMKMDSIQFALKEAKKREKPVESMLIAIDILCDLLSEKRADFNNILLNLKK